MTTDQREQEMARIKRVAEIMAQLDSEPLNARVVDMLDRYPRMPRERDEDEQAAVLTAVERNR